MADAGRPTPVPDKALRHPTNDAATPLSPAPSPSLTAPEDAVPLISQEINIATRKIHHDLNRLITSRLPLAASPSSAQLYAQGLRHFAHVYLTFESLWRDLAKATQQSGGGDGGISEYRNPGLSTLLDDPWLDVSGLDALVQDSTSAPSSPALGQQGRASQEVLQFLTHLLPANLPRSAALRGDLATLLKLPSSVDLDLTLSQYPGGKIAEFSRHIRRRVREKPWVLIAYAWVMYMAIFSGGRWIRGTLVQGFETAAGQAGEGKGKAGAEGEPEPEVKERKGAVWEKGKDMSLSQARAMGLSFFFFEGSEEDGEDVKREFKTRLLGAEGLLTTQQRKDVVDEAGEIFRYCIAMVEELDAQCQTPEEVRDAKYAERKVREAMKAHQPKAAETNLDKVVNEAKEAGKKKSRGFDVGDLWSSGRASGMHLLATSGFAGLAVVVSAMGWWALSGGAEV